LAPESPAKTVTEKVPGTNSRSRNEGMSPKNGAKSVVKSVAKSEPKAAQKNGARASANGKPPAQKNVVPAKSKSNGKSAPAASGKRR
jgi:hypothetical protein